MIRRPPRSTLSSSSAASDVYKRQLEGVAGLQVLHDRRVPGTKGNVDHILIAPAGVFVVDAKHYEGRIEIRNRGWFLRPDYRLYVGGRDRSALADGLGWQVETVERVLLAAAIDPMPPITPVLCFIDGDWPLINPPSTFAGVRLESERSVKRLVGRGTAVDPRVIEQVSRILAAALPAK